MRLFGPIYERAIRWAAHPHAERYLALLSFVEAFIFPVAPEVMLAPMVLAQPGRAWRYASVSLGFSLLGALIGYALGHYAYEFVKPLLAHLHMLSSIEAGVTKLRTDMHAHFFGMLVILALAALQPLVPMKVITWACGIVGVPLLPFLVCILIGRGKRVFLLAGALRWGGERAERALHKHIEWLGWLAIGLVAVLLIYGFWFR